MYCDNKNNLLDIYFHEGIESENKEIRHHVNTCTDCQKYLKNLRRVTNLLDNLIEEKPESQIFERILSEVSGSVQKPVKSKAKFSAIPIFQIGFGLLFIISIIYIINSKISLLPIWNSIENYWLVQTFGSIGVAVAVVFLIGIFITLSLAPILVFESEKRKSFS